MFDNDERIIVLAQRVRAHPRRLITDTLIERNCEIRGDHVRAVQYIIRCSSKGKQKQKKQSRKLGLNIIRQTEKEKVQAMNSSCSHTGCSCSN